MRKISYARLESRVKKYTFIILFSIIIFYYHAFFLLQQLRDTVLNVNVQGGPEKWATDSWP